MKLIIIIITSFLMLNCAKIVFSQDSTVTFTVPELKIYQVENKKEVIYIFDKERNVFSLTGDTLYADPGFYKYKVAIGNLNKVAVRDGTNIMSGFLYAGGGGFLVGFLIGVFAPKDADSHHSEGHPGATFAFNGGLGAGMVLGLVLGLATGIIGGVVGLVSPNYEEYEMKGSDIIAKQNKLNKVLKEWNIKIK